MEMPEEVNRVLTDRLSNKLFIPTETAAENLKNEGYSDDKKIILTGDVMYDASLYYSQFSEKKSTLPEELMKDDFILCTFHRAQNTNNADRLKGIVEALNKINEKIQVIVPLHPRTKKYIEEYGLSVIREIIFLLIIKM